MTGLSQHQAWCRINQGRECSCKGAKMVEWILTFRGHEFAPSRPELRKIDILDIAHALGHLCRFGGHTREFYSVAQHSVLVCKIVEERGGNRMEQFQALMHDASEAYLVDIPSPIKQQFPEYKAMEELVQTAIHRAFGMLPSVSPIVKVADQIALATEARDFMEPHPCWQNLAYKPVFPRLTAWSSKNASEQFLAHFRRFSSLHGEDADDINAGGAEFSGEVSG